MSYLEYDIKDRSLLRMARADLCFAIQYCTDSRPYQMRLFGTVVAITKQLNDKKEFIRYMTEQNMQCVDCHPQNYLGCELHGTRL